MATWQERALRHVNRPPEQRSKSPRMPLILSAVLLGLALPVVLLAMNGASDAPSAATVTMEAGADEAPAASISQASVAQSGAHIPAGAEAYTHEALLSLLRAAGWPESAIPDAVAVAGCESGWFPGAVGTVGELGIFQVHPVHFPRFEARWGAEARPANPLQNAIIAREIWAEQGWRPWSCAPEG